MIECVLKVSPLNVSIEVVQYICRTLEILRVCRTFSFHCEGKWSPSKKRTFAAFLIMQRVSPICRANVLNMGRRLCQKSVDCNIYKCDTYMRSHIYKYDHTITCVLTFINQHLDMWPHIYKCDRTFTCVLTFINVTQHLDMWPHIYMCPHIYKCDSMFRYVTPHL